MDVKAPTYEELQARLAEAENTLKAINSDGIDAVVGQKGVYLLRLHEMEKALRESEEKFRKAFVLAAVGFVLATPKGQFVEANTAYCDIVGYDVEELKGRDVMGLIHPDDHAGNQMMVERLLSGEIPHFILENRYVRKGGEVVWARKSVSLVHDDQGRPQWIIALVENISDRKRMEAELRRSNQELSEFTNALTHNVKAPFRAVQNYANFLLEDLADKLEGEPKQFLDGIKKAISMANHQFEDLEALYKVKDHPLEFESLDMCKLLGEIAALHNGSQGRELVIEAQWPMLQGEWFLLRQILMALVNNGLKYNESEIKRVEVTWRDGANRRFEIIVRDNGIGIDPRYHEQIFRIFQRLHTEQEYEGTGIGLAVVRKAVKRLGGEVRIESAVGEGSTFVISLPATMVELASEHNQ